MGQSVIIKEDFLKELPKFENFLNQIGFKRVEGSIYGLLVLCERALTSEEIEKILGLSQSAVSQGLKSLSHYGAIETYTAPGQRQRYHQAKEDSLSIASTVFKKREQQLISDFRQMASSLLALSLKNGNDPKHPRVKRLKSIIVTCQLAEAVMNFVIELTTLDLQKHYPDIVDKLPRVLRMMTEGIGPMSNIAEQFSKTLKHGLKKWSSSINGELQ